MQAKTIINKKDNSNIIGLGAIAKEEKKKDNEVINSTTGMLYGEDAKLFTYNSVNEAISLLSNEERFAYFPTGGNKVFNESIKSWVFGKYYNDFKDISKVVPTPGGTGALSNSFTNYLGDDDYCLLPNFMWTNYKQILFEENKKYQEYQLFDKDGNFNLNDLKEKALNIINKNKRVMILINDPAQNPTGYTLKEDEVINLVDLLNELSSLGEVTFVIDAAYIDYADEYEKTRNILSKYLKLNEDIILIIAFSASKSFGLYGLRVGAQVIVTKNKEVLDDSYSTNVFSSRAKWSNTSSLGISLISRILNDDKLKEKYLKELNDSRLMLKKRSDLFKEEISKYGIKILPYEAGFFVSIETDKPMELYDKLRKLKLHIVPFDNSIRITLSSITLDEVKRIPNLLKKVM